MCMKIIVDYCQTTLHTLDVSDYPPTEKNSLIILANVGMKNREKIANELENEVVQICVSKKEYFSELFKKYNKQLKLEVIFNKTAGNYKVSISLNLKSKKLLLAKEGKNIIKLTNSLFSDFKKMAKRQYELEKKEFEYKRKR